MGPNTLQAKCKDRKLLGYNSGTKIHSGDKRFRETELGRIVLRHIAKTNTAPKTTIPGTLSLAYGSRVVGVDKSVEFFLFRFTALTG